MKPKISEMLAYYAPHAIVTDGKTTNPPPDNQWGYYMGGDGRVATDAYAMQRAKSSYPDNWQAYYEVYKKWIGHHVFDCNSIAEAFYKLRTGENIDTKARNNFASWCSTKDISERDNKLANMPQLPGIALFSGPTNSAAGITHVGFLFKKYGPGPLNWYVLECRGKDYGLVITTLQSRLWEWWGMMDKHFEYDLTEDGRVEDDTKEEPKVAKVITKNLTFDADVQALQTVLNALGYDCGTADGKAGDNTMKGIAAFCAAHGAPVEVPAALPNTLALTVSVGDKKYTIEMK